MNVVCYARVSTEEQAKLGTSLSSQEQRAREFVKARGFKLVDVYIDDGHSGGDFQRRPGLNRLKKDAALGKFSAVICHSLDRLGRDGVELLHLIYKELNPLGVKFFFMEDNLESDRDDHRLMIFIKSQLAEERRKEIRESSRRGKLSRIEQGKWVGGHPPFGYQIDRETHTLVRCEEESKIVEYVFKLYEKGHGVMAITYKINEEKVPTCSQRVYLPTPRWCSIIRKEKKSNSCYLRIYHDEYEQFCVPCIEKHGEHARIKVTNGWGKSTISRILHNPLYTGQMVWCRKKFTKNGKVITTEPDNWIIRPAPGNEVLIGASRFEKVQNKLAKHNSIPPRIANSSFLLTGIIFCECGSPMNGKYDNRKWRAYLCNARRLKGSSICDNAAVNVNKIEPFVLNHIRKFLTSIKDESYFKTGTWEKGSVQEKHLKEEKEALQAKLKDNRRRVAKLISLFESEIEEFPDIKDRLRALEEERKNLEEEILRKEEEKRNLQSNLYSEETIKVFARDFEANWKEATPREKKELIKFLVHKITCYKNRKIRVEFAF